jgi:putative ABC transport system permease protein
MKRLFDPLITAWTMVVTHKLRSFLTILGVVIGVSCVIILMSLGQGTQVMVTDSFSALGSNVIFITPGSANQTSIGSATGGRPLTQEDAEAIAANVPNITAVAPANSTGVQVIAGNQNMFVQITGVTPEYQRVNSIEVVGGYFINQDQLTGVARVALIGATVNSTLFPGKDPIGQTIRAGNDIFHVVGVLKSKGASLSSTDTAILIPLTTLQGMVSTLTISGQHQVNTIYVQAADKNSSATVKNEIVNLLHSRHQILAGESDDFTVTSLDEIASAVNSVLNTLTLFLAAIAGISLLVGGIGVMNIMLVSVVERRREIGVRKALGAKERDIWGQFLVDAALLTFSGGVIGVAIGWGVSILVSSTGILTAVVTSGSVLLAVGVSVGIGLVFGFLPAWQGARLDPIQALRSE